MTGADVIIHCMICGTAMTPCFSKTFSRLGLGKVDYVKCPGCGLVISKTHHLMAPEEWNRLNSEYHSFHGGDEAPDDTRWVERLSTQSRVIRDLWGRGLLPDDRGWVDYGCGDGKLCDMLAERGLSVFKYDRYMEPRGDMLSDAEIERRRPFDAVITTSVFEHLRGRRELEDIHGLLSPDGVFILHTWVAETVPLDPGWFYLLPVHCAFYSNRSMDILFREWGFKSSLYHTEARMWFWFRDEKELDIDGFEFKKGFVDYWR